jgi:DNA-binding NarL/FixJ family response regulator
MSRTLVIVDDNAGFRRTARRVLEQDGFDVVGEAGDGSSAIALVRRLRPSVTLVDCCLPGIDGIEVAAELAHDTDVVLTSTRDRGDYGDAIEKSGARGFVAKDELCGAALIGLVAGPS